MCLQTAPELQWVGKAATFWQSWQSGQSHVSGLVPQVPDCLCCGGEEGTVSSTKRLVAEQRLDGASRTDRTLVDSAPVPSAESGIPTNQPRREADDGNQDHTRHKSAGDFVGIGLDWRFTVLCFLDCLRRKWCE